MKYIDAKRLTCLLEAKYKDFIGKAKIKGYTTLQYQYMADGIDVAEQLIDSLQQEQQEKKEVKFVFPKFLYARTTNNKTIDVSYAPQSLDAVEYIRSNFLQQEQPEVFDTIAFQKGVQEGRRLEREDALTIADIEMLHALLYAVKNNKQIAFTFTSLSDEQYEEVLRRFNNAKEK